MEEKLVTVIVLTFRKFDLLSKNIESIARQTYKNIELIISDDGSDNFDRKIIEQLINKWEDMFNNTIIIKHKNNVGTVRNFNDAIKKANGDIIIPLASDDVFINEKVVESIVKEFLVKNSLILTAKRKVNKGMNEILPRNSDIKYFEYDREVLLSRMLEGNFISGACTYYNKKVFDIIGLFDEEFYLLEDYPFYIKALTNGINIDFIDLVTIKYSLEGISNSKNINPLLLKDSIKVYEKIYSNKMLKFWDRRIIKKNILLSKYNGKKYRKLVVKFLYIDVNIIKAIRRVK